MALGDATVGEKNQYRYAPSHDKILSAIISVITKVNSGQVSGYELGIYEKLQELIKYAYSEKYGFLTQCPSNVGTGLRASVMVHLPALTATGNIQKILDIISNFGMDIRGIYGEGSKIQGNMYQISNKQSLGISEMEIIKSLKVITEKIIEQERLARKHLGKNSKV